MTGRCACARDSIDVVTGLCGICGLSCRPPRIPMAVLDVLDLGVATPGEDLILPPEAWIDRMAAPQDELDPTGLGKPEPS